MSTHTGGGLASAPATSPAASLDWAAVEPKRARLKSLGSALIVLGCIGLWCAWAWFSCALCIALGSVLLDSFVSRQRFEAKLARTQACCGAHPTPRTDGCCGERPEPRTDACCCAPYHVVGLTIAALVFACVDVTWAFITVCALGRDFLAARVWLCTTYSIYNRFNPCDESYKRGLRYMVVVWSITVILSLLLVLLLSLVLSTYRQLAAIVRLDKSAWLSAPDGAAATAGPARHHAVGAYAPQPQQHSAPQLVYVVPTPGACCAGRRIISLPV